MALTLNWFQLAFSRHAVELPTFEYATQESRNDDRDRFREYTRVTLNDPPRMVLLAGPEPPPGYEIRRFELLDSHALTKRWLTHALICWSPDDSYTRVALGGAVSFLQRKESLAHPPIELRAGVRAKPFQSSSGDPFGLTLSWDVSCEFTKSLADDELAAIARGVRVVYRPPEGRAAEELADRVGRDVGAVQELDAQSAVVGRRKAHVRIPREHLYLQGNDSAIGLYEQKIKNSQTNVPRLRQRHSFALTKSNRRNPRVVQDRVEHVRRFFGHPGRVAIELPLPGFDECTAELSLSPAIVK